MKNIPKEEILCADLFSHACLVLPLQQITHKQFLHYWIHSIHLPVHNKYLILINPNDFPCFQDAATDQQTPFFQHNIWFKNKILRTWCEFCLKRSESRKKCFLYQEILKVKSWLCKPHCFPDCTRFIPGTKKKPCKLIIKSHSASWATLNLGGIYSDIKQFLNIFNTWLHLYNWIASLLPETVLLG